jgi:tetratricopeptide (TPR) repeat protein
MIGAPMPGLRCVQRLNCLRIVAAATLVLAFSPAALHAGNAGCESSLKTSARAAQLMQSIAQHPTVGAYDALGSLYAAARQTECALAAFHSAIQLDSKSKEARYDLALELRIANELPQADAELQDLLRDDPDFALGHEARGEILFDEKKNQEARSEFEAALRSDETFSAADEGLVQIALAMQQSTAAIYWANRGLAAKPAPAMEYKLRLDLGTAEGNAGEFSEAEKTLRSLADAYPEQVDPHLNLGIIEVHLENYRAARQEFNRVLKLDNGNDAARLALAQADLFANQPDEALQMALEYTKRVPDDPKGFATLGSAYRAENQYLEAVAAYSKSRAMNPNDYDVLFGLGMSQVGSGQREQALQSFQAAEKVDASKAPIHYQIFRLLAGDKTRSAMAASEVQTYKKLEHEDEQSAKTQLAGAEANASLDQGNAQQAADLYRKVLENNPKDANSHYNLSLALSQLGDRDGERSELRAALAIDPNMAQALNRVGLLELQDGHTNEAARDFQAVLDIDPGSTDAKINLATVYGKTGRTPEAEELFREAADAAPDSLAAHLNLGLVLAGEGRLQDAIPPLQTAARLSPGNPQPLTILGIVYGKMAQSPESILYLKKARALAPESADAHLNLGIALADGFDLAGAAAQFAEAEKLAPTAAIVHFNAGRVAFDQGDSNKARGELEQACNLEKNYPGALQLLARLDLHENRPQPAIDLLHQVLALQPENEDAQYLLGQALLAAGRKQEAIGEWQQALAANPEDTRIYWTLAHQLPASDPKRATYLARLQAVEGNERSAGRAKTLANIAISAASNHEWADAMEKMAEAIQACGNCSIQASLQQNLGLIFAEHGELQKAEQALRRSVTLDPKTPHAQEELAIVRNLEKHASAQ